MKVAGTSVKLFFRFGDERPTYDLNFSGNSLSGTYFGAGPTRTVERAATFTKR